MVADGKNLGRFLQIDGFSSMIWSTLAEHTLNVGEEITYHTGAARFEYMSGKVRNFIFCNIYEYLQKL